LESFFERCVNCCRGVRLHAWNHVAVFERHAPSGRARRTSARSQLQSRGSQALQNYECHSKWNDTCGFSLLARLLNNEIFPG
jgi:hypothetical protein